MITRMKYDDPAKNLADFELRLLFRGVDFEIELKRSRRVSVDRVLAVQIPLHLLKKGIDH